MTELTVMNCSLLEVCGW